MKKQLILIALLFAFLVSCNGGNNDDVAPGTFANRPGCQFGTLKSTGEVKFIRCCTYKQSAAGTNQAEGGLNESTWKLYTNLRFVDEDNCAECSTKDYSKL